jgi:hypothetical protein
VAALRIEQLKLLVENIRLYGLGSQLQEIVLTENHLFLQHYAKVAFTIGVELKPLAPRLGYFYGDIPKKKSLVKPIVLFLKAHARNHRLTNIITDETLGRVIKLIYGSNCECEVEIRLIPHGVNIIVKTPEKSLSLFPAKSLPPSSTTTDNALRESFDIEGYLDDWMGAILGGSSKKVAVDELDVKEKRKQKEVAKKQSLINKLQDDLKSMDKPWLAVGEYLKIHQSIEVPEDWAKLIDPAIPLNANMQRCFDRHKLQEKRKEQMIERIEHLVNEIDELQSESHSIADTPGRPVKSLAGELLSKAKAKGRKLILSEGIEAVFGKSAKDNMALLRRAQGWDLWLHLRDLPGSHLIVRRPRQKNVDHQLLVQAALWLLKETIGKKKVIEGDRYDVIVTECRYVKPIKGDKLGRVNYQNETTLTLRV